MSMNDSDDECELLTQESELEVCVVEPKPEPWKWPRTKQRHEPHNESYIPDWKQDQRDLNWKVLGCLSVPIGVLFLIMWLFSLVGRT
jgi:hypothetical protein